MALLLLATQDIFWVCTVLLLVVLAGLMGTILVHVMVVPIN